MSKSFVAFDFETTGFSQNDTIIEIGAVKVVDGKIIAEFSELVNPGVEIPWRITNITGITNSMVKGKDDLRLVLPRFLEFAGDFLLVAHNTDFDCRFLHAGAMQIDHKVENPTFCTLKHARRFYPRAGSYSLGNLTTLLGIPLNNAHRALADAEAAAKLYLLMHGG